MLLVTAYWYLLKLKNLSNYDYNKTPNHINEHNHKKCDSDENNQTTIPLDYGS